METNLPEFESGGLRTSKARHTLSSAGAVIHYQLLDDEEEVAAGQPLSFHRPGIFCAAVWRFVQVFIGNTERRVQKIVFFLSILVRTGIM